MSADTFQLVLSTTQDGRTKDLRFRQRQFRSLHEWITVHVVEIQAAAQKDDDVLMAEAEFLAIDCLNMVRKFYDALSLENELASEYKVKYGLSSPERRVPEEITYVVPETRLIFFNVMSILCACIAAGSCCIVELPNGAVTSKSLLQSLLREALDRSAFVSIEERPPITVLSHHLFVDQTGSVPPGGLARLLRSEAHEVAVAVVDRTANLDLAAQEILKATSAFSGRGRYVPIKLLVNEFVEKQLVELLLKHSDRSLSRFTSGEEETSTNSIHTNQDQENFTSMQRDQEITISNHNCHIRFQKISHRDNLWRYNEASDAQKMTWLSTTSHDDVIDAVNAGKQEALLALYVFADGPAAKYLTQFIHTRASFVNYIPTQILSYPSGYPMSPDALYSRAMIESWSPQFVSSGPSDWSLLDLTQEVSKRRQEELSYALRPLKPTGQPKAGSMNFFQMGLMAGVVFYAIPFLVISICGSVAILKGVRRWTSRP